ncbi:DUF418 domain-containing protein [Luteibacter aegosomatis]|uniref:DUF418 domain-containing protein n=1 Tax=Luteibacter aegosomatis TaxID=2911537 RepID=UPI001FFB29C2|nr:DUF418 domain-containing protein [Luteibacter aegosomatis]UPG85497.1 DUF418 domain-containing protein [Luteibacter aegosomatis]
MSADEQQCPRTPSRAPALFFRARCGKDLHGQKSNGMRFAKPWNRFGYRTEKLLNTSVVTHTPHRIQSLDVIRGIAILGVLAVNADGFAAPIHASLKPSAWMFGNEGSTAVAYWWMDWLFHEKFVAIFSMLFGVSLFLVGGPLSDKRRGINLARRLGALFVFALIHGFGLWWGDILSTYACAGVVMFGLRSLPSKALLGTGIAILLATTYMALPRGDEPAPSSATISHEEARTAAPAHSATSSRVRAELAEATGSASGAYALNTRTYLHQLANLWQQLPRTIALMMVGLGLFKAGFFNGAISRTSYASLVMAGGLALAVLGAMTWMTDVSHLSFRWGEFVNELLCPLVAVGYAAAIVLSLRRKAGRWFVPFAAAGRMAFTNYLTQSLIMTSIFYGGRGALMGTVDRPALWGIVAGVWALQLAWSTWWLSRFEMGPLEWIWRWITYGRRSPFVRPSPAFNGPAEVRRT